MKYLWMAAAAASLFVSSAAFAQRDWDDRRGDWNGSNRTDRRDSNWRDNNWRDSDWQDNNWRDNNWRRDNDRRSNEYRKDRRELGKDIERLQRLQREIDRKLAEIHNDHRRRDYREARRDEEQLDRLRAERARINREIEQDRRELRDDRRDWRR